MILYAALISIIYILYNILYIKQGKDSSYWKIIIHCKGAGDRFWTAYQL